MRGRRGDGYHELESLVTFAEVHDVLTLTPGAGEGLVASGPFAPAIVGENLLTRTLRLLRAADPGLRLGAVHLEKNLPVAAGLGGGSADAAALLRAVRGANTERADAVPWPEIAEQLGADVPMCLAQRPAVARGRGERLAPVVRLPALHAVLVNPGVPLVTASVFAAFRPSSPPAAAATEALSEFPDLDALLDCMRAQGNDLEPAAIALLPVIAEVKSRLLAEADCRFAAMSGSGPTCFGVFPTRETARHAATTIAADKPGWWVEPTVLSGAPETGSDPLPPSV